jgi:hypothetical protein
MAMIEPIGYLDVGVQCAKGTSIDSAHELDFSIRAENLISTNSNETVVEP